jgi:hypothetical protein
MTARQGDCDNANGEQDVTLPSQEYSAHVLTLYNQKGVIFDLLRGDVLSPDT